MFTVILLSDAAKQIFAPAEAYFAPYVEAGQIAFCDWNQSTQAREMWEAMPNLPEIIRGKSSWRAVVVDHPRASTVAADARDPENPFDYLDNVRPSLNLEDSKHALIRAAHILLGYPQMSAKTFKPLLQYEDSETGEPKADTPENLLVDISTHLGSSVEIEFDPAEHNDEELFSFVATLIGQKHNNVRRLFAEVPYTDEEHARHEELSERYRMKEVRPSEVVFIATRTGVEEDEKSKLQRAWKTNEEHRSSRFVERNDYPPLSRFAVYELLEPENSGYDQDLLRFWLGVLTLAINLVPPGAFQADRLYRFGVDFGAPELGEMLNAHISRLAMVRDHLDRLISARAKPPSIENADLLEPLEAHVAFDDLGGKELAARSRGYGLAADIPRDEYQRWSEEVGRVSSAAALFMRRPRRLVARAVYGARELVRVSTGEAVVLDEFDRDELEDRLNKRLRALVVPATTTLLDEGRLQRGINRGNVGVRDYIRQRMRGTTIWVALLLAFGIWFAASVPYLARAAGHGIEPLLDAGLLALIILVVIAAAGLIALLGMRYGLLRRIASFNERVEREVALVHSGASRFAAYLSDFATYRRGSEHLRGSLKARELRAVKLQRFKRLRSRIVQRIAEEKEIVLSLGVPLQVLRTSQGLADYDPEDQLAERHLFRFPEGERRIPFNDSGAFVRAPYDFLQALRLHRVPLFEQDGPGSKAAQG